MFREFNISLFGSFARLVLHTLSVAFISRYFEKPDIGYSLLIVAYSRIVVMIILNGRREQVVLNVNKYYRTNLLRTYSANYQKTVIYVLFFLSIIVLSASPLNSSVCFLILLYVLTRTFAEYALALFVAKKAYIKLLIVECLGLIMTFPVLFLLKGVEGIISSLILSNIVILFYAIFNDYVTLKSHERINYNTVKGKEYRNAELINYVSRNIDTFLVEWALGINTATQYFRSFGIVEIVPNTVGKSLNNVLFPNYSLLNKKEIWFSLRKVILAILILGITISFIVSHMSDWVVAIYLGEGWEQTAKFLSILIWNVTPRLFLKATGPVFKACSLMRAFNRFQLILMFAIASLMLLTYFKGIYALLWGYVGVNCIYSLSQILFVYSELQKK